MIKKIFLALAVALPLSMSAQKFGVISAEEVLAQMPEAADVQAKIAEASKQYEDEFQRIQQEIENKYAEYQKLQQDGSNSQSILDRRVQELQDLDRKAQQFVQTAQQDLERQQMQLMQPVQEKLINAIQAVGQENGFTMIFPNVVPAYVSADVVDVTPLVKTKLGIK